MVEILLQRLAKSHAHTGIPEEAGIAAEQAHLREFGSYCFRGPVAAASIEHERGQFGIFRQSLSKQKPESYQRSFATIETSQRNRDTKRIFHQDSHGKVCYLLAEARCLGFTYQSSH